MFSSIWKFGLQYIEHLMSDDTVQFSSGSLPSWSHGSCPPPTPQERAAIAPLPHSDHPIGTDLMASCALLEHRNNITPLRLRTSNQ